MFKIATLVTATGWRLRTSAAIGAGNANVAKLVTAGGAGRRAVT